MKTTLLIELYDLEAELIELHEQESEKVCGGEGIGSTVSGTNEESRDLGYQNSNKRAREYGYTNYGKAVSNYAQYVNGSN